MLAVTTVFRVGRRAVTPAATSASLRIVPPWTNPIGLASLGSIWEEMIDFDSLTGFEGLIAYRPPSPRNLALSRRDEGSDSIGVSLVFRGREIRVGHVVWYRYCVC